MTSNSIKTSHTFFDKFNNQDIEKFSLTNKNGVTVSAITLGATLYEFSIPTSSGRANLVLNYPNSSDYLANPFYVSMGIGRTGGRIKDSRLLLNGDVYQLQSNEGTTNLHGGPNGFNTHIWDGEISEQNNDPVIKFHRVQKHSEDAFPGDLDVTITYHLTDDNTLKLTFEATALDQDTVFNPTYHTYFNLGDTDTILNHKLMVNSDQHLEFDDKKIPTGNMIPVENTPFDFRKMANLGDAIKEMQDTVEKGFDDIFKINDASQNHTIAKLQDSKTGRTVKINSDRNGLVVFTANSFTKEDMNFSRTNGIGIPYEGVALEAQNLPDATRFEGFGDIVIPKNETRSHEISYHVDF